MTDVQTFFKEPKKPPRRRAHNSTLPAPTGRKRKPATGQTGVTPQMRADVYRRAGGMCQADGLHHPDCPGRLPHGDWSAHHVHERSKGGPDTVENLIAVWCPMGLGLNGCHGRVHGNPAQARALGLLGG